MIDKQSTLNNINDKEKIEKLVIASKQNDRYAFIQLCDVYSSLISSVAKSFSVSTNDYEDLFQEGRIALYRAVCKYDSSKASFTTFAAVCIKNALTSFVRTYHSKSKLPADSISLDDSNSGELVAFDDITPEDILIETEFFLKLEKIIEAELSDFEQTVFRYKLIGMSAAEISAKIGKDKKDVENSLFRARKKLKFFLSEN